MKSSWLLLLLMSRSCQMGQKKVIQLEKGFLSLEDEEDGEEDDQETPRHPLVTWRAWHLLSLVGVAGSLNNGFLLHTFYR